MPRMVSETLSSLSFQKLDARSRPVVCDFCVWVICSEMIGLVISFPDEIGAVESVKAASDIVSRTAFTLRKIVIVA